MGIKGIYSEIGPGQRVALARLAIENYERTERPLRIAVDISIWQFQIQSGKGGSNPALRTLYYRLLRLLSMSIRPLFVFDGSQKPPFKRNKRTGNAGPSLTDSNMKHLLKLFGFPFHVAPGEAEAECALLQREGFVDAVLSEDVDTLMFGCGKTLRKWSAEESRGHRVPTHVTVYDVQTIDEGISGLNREGMILVALMSGGDYITEGIPGCGIKIACEAARAGFGRSLCRLSKTDTAGLNLWRQSLINELQSNESKFFRVRHKSLQIPENFPNKEVLGYYTHPVVSSAARLGEMREEIRWDEEVDVIGLRLFVAESFDWTHKTGARKFIRGLAPALLASKLRRQADRRRSGFDDTVHPSMNEEELIKEISGRRLHFSTDGIPELNLLYHPAKTVGLDLDNEVDESEDFGRDGLAPIDENHIPQAYNFESGSESGSRTQLKLMKRNIATYDPNQFQKAWVPETIAKVGIPLMVEDYEEAQRKSRSIIKQKPTLKRASKKAAVSGGMPKGALDRYFNAAKATTKAQDSPPSKKFHSTPQDLPLAYDTPHLNDELFSCKINPSQVSQSEYQMSNKTMSRRGEKPGSITKDSKLETSAQKKGLTYGNPWMIAHSSSLANQNSHFPIVSISKPGNFNERKTTTQQTKSIIELPTVEQKVGRSRPSSPLPLGKHLRSISSSLNQEISSDSSNIPYSISPVKKRISNAAVSEVRPAVVLGEDKAYTRDVINIPSSPIALSISVLVSENRSEGSARKIIQKSAQRKPRNQTETKGAKFLIARESLEGTWKEVDQEPAGGVAWRLSGIDVLDMTGN